MSSAGLQNSWVSVQSNTTGGGSVPQNLTVQNLSVQNSLNLDPGATATLGQKVEINDAGQLLVSGLLITGTNGSGNPDGADTGLQPVPVVGASSSLFLQINTANDTFLLNDAVRPSSTGAIDYVVPTLVASAPTVQLGLPSFNNIPPVITSVTVSSFGRCEIQGQCRQYKTNSAGTIPISIIGRTSTAPNSLQTIVPITPSVFPTPPTYLPATTSVGVPYKTLQYNVPGLTPTAPTFHTPADLDASIPVYISFNWAAESTLTGAGAPAGTPITVQTWISATSGLTSSTPGTKLYEWGYAPGQLAPIEGGTYNYVINQPVLLQPNTDYYMYWVFSLQGGTISAGSVSLSATQFSYNPVPT